MSTLSCDNIVKDYPGTRALDHVSASFDSGKINALLGKNGSGKSTLCKIFAGAESATSGEFYLDGQKLSFRNPTDAAKSGIVLVYQETSLVPTLTVMENIFMGRLPKKTGGLINWKLVQSETERLLKVMDVRINPKSKIMHLPMWQRQVVEICKALSQDPKVLILDEPTSALAKAEVEKLFAAIRKVKENDVIIIYISHKLAEIHEIADTVTVLRDAQYVGKKNIEEIDNAGMIAMMFGKTEIRKRPADVVPTDEPVMEVKHLTRAGWYEDISFTLYKGEVLGIVGESGSGKSVTAYSLMGLTAYPGRLIGGTLDFNGHHINDMSEKEMRRIRGNEVSIIFQDPMTSLNPVYTIGNQIREVILLHTGKSKKEANERAKELLTLVGINEPEKRLKQYPHELSGGMRQRVMIAIALACEPKLLIADEPTTALDVTIQAQILELMMDLKEKLGMAIIMITHDLGIVARMCEKIAVMYAGKIVEYGTTDEIFYEPKHEYTKGLLRSIPRLDSKDHERLVPIEGTPVDMLNPPKGCPFAPRCGACMKVCLREMPPRTDFSDTHYTQCWLCQKAEFEAAQGGNVQ